MPNGDTESELTLHGALHTPAVGCTLVSVAALDEEGYHAHIGAGHLELTSPQGERIRRIPRTQGRLYKVVHVQDSANAVEPVSVIELHRRLGHIAPSTARKLVDSGVITGIELDPNSQETDCDTCIYARATHQPIPKVRISPPAANFRDLVHTDVWGPATIATRQGQKYFITFTDDATRYTITFPLRLKDEALTAYKMFEAWAVAQQHCQAVKVLHSNRGGEFLSGEFDGYLQSQGTVRKLTTHHTPELNGISERLNRMLMDRIRRLTHDSGLPKSLWGEALRHTTWLKNQTATRALDGKMPYEALYGRPPDLSALRDWGSRVLMHDPTRSKLSPHAHEARWIGPNTDTKTHRVFWPRSGNVSVERNVYFGLTAPLEGEDEEPARADGEQPAAPRTPSTSHSTESPGVPTLVDVKVEDDNEDHAEQQQQQQQQQQLLKSQPLPLHRFERLRKPSHVMRDLQAGKGVTLTRAGSPKVSMGLTIPESVEEEDKAGGVWVVIDSAPALLEDFKGLEHTFLAETSDTEAVEPQMLAEAKRCPNWI